MAPSNPKQPQVAIVDYGMGNLFSVRHACQYVGLEASITSSQQEIVSADAVILPGVGAFGDAMEALRRFDLTSPLKDVAASSKPLLGICLGMQLFMSESVEFGRHSGLGIIPGTVVRLENALGANGVLKVPHVCWNRLNRAAGAEDLWEGSLLSWLLDGVFMYFVHSFQVKPEDANVVIATTSYGIIEFCSAISYGNIFACQCHPERSGPEGLKVYSNLASLLRVSKSCEESKTNAQSENH